MMLSNGSNGVVGGGGAGQRPGQGVAVDLAGGLRREGVDDGQTRDERGGQPLLEEGGGDAGGDRYPRNGGDGGGASLGKLGAINAGSFRPSQARILLAAALATGTDPAELFLH